MFIESVPNRDSPPAVLLRESYRDENGRSQKRTLANLSKLPGDIVDGLKVLLKGGTVIGTGPDEMRVARSLPHGHVAAVLGTLRRIALDRLMLSTAKDAARSAVHPNTLPPRFNGWTRRSVAPRRRRSGAFRIAGE